MLFLKAELNKYYYGEEEEEKTSSAKKQPHDCSPGSSLLYSVGPYARLSLSLLPEK
jgi:hypothetical protein